MCYSFCHDKYESHVTLSAEFTSLQNFWWDMKKFSLLGSNPGERDEGAELFWNLFWQVNPGFAIPVAKNLFAFDDSRPKWKTNIFCETWELFILGKPSLKKKIREIFNCSHHSWMGQSTKIATREVVYYILSGTPRASQKCFQSNLRVEFSGGNHLFFDMQLTKHLDSGWYSDLFKKFFYL